jgi:DNA ligase-1
MSFKPLKSATPPLGHKFNFPLLGSPKIDGIRIYVDNGVAKIATSLKLVPNRDWREKLSNHRYDFIDGESINGEPFGEGNSVMSRSSTGTMTEYGCYDMSLYVFDQAQYTNEPYYKRLERAAKVVKETNDPFIKLVDQVELKNQDDMDELEEKYVNLKYEGIMVRDPNGIYKYGRSTVNQGIIFKIKRFHDEEGTIVGFQQFMSNQNELEEDNFGYAKRASLKENMVPKEMLGAFILENPKYSAPYNLGGGIPMDLRTHFWKIRDSLLGKKVTYKTMSYGVKDKPRQLSYKAIRDGY